MLFKKLYLIFLYFKLPNCDLNMNYFKFLFYTFSIRITNGICCYPWDMKPFNRLNEFPLISCSFIPMFFFFFCSNQIIFYFSIGNLKKKNKNSSSMVDETWVRWRPYSRRRWWWGGEWIHIHKSCYCSDPLVGDWWFKVLLNEWTLNSWQFFSLSVVPFIVILTWFACNNLLEAIIWWRCFKPCCGCCYY